MTAISITALRRKMLALYEAPLKASRTRQKIDRQLDLLEATGIKSSRALTTDRLAAYVAKRYAEGIGANTIRGELDYVRTIVNFCIEEGYLSDAPSWKRLRPKRRKAQVPKLHTVEEIARLLGKLKRESGTWKGYRLYALTSTVAYTGLRRDEALYLQVGDIDLKRGLLEVVARAPGRDMYKTEGSEATVPIPRPLVRVLRAWIPMTGSTWLFPGVRRKGPWVGGTNGERACDMVALAGEEAGIPGRVTLLSLRHTFATWARRKWGLSALQLQEILRHTSPATQQHYLHEDPDQGSLVQSVRNVNYGRAG